MLPAVKNERIGQLFILRGKNQEPVQEIGAGDIGAVAKLSVTATGDTLGAKDKPVKLVSVTFPEPRYSEAVYPKTKLDLDKLGFIAGQNRGRRPDSENAPRSYYQRNDSLRNW